MNSLNNIVIEFSQFRQVKEMCAVEDESRGLEKFFTNREGNSRAFFDISASANFIQDDQRLWSDEL